PRRSTVSFRSYHESIRPSRDAAHQSVSREQTCAKCCVATTVARCCTSMQQEKPRPTRPLRYCCTPLRACATLEKAGTTSRATSRDICAAWCNTAQQRATDPSRRLALHLGQSFAQPGPGEFFFEPAVGVIVRVPRRNLQVPRRRIDQVSDDPSF